MLRPMVELVERIEQSLEGVEADKKVIQKLRYAKKNWRKGPFRSSNFHYNPERNCFYCPMGQAMRHIGDRKQKTTNGFEQTISRYQAQNCEGCPLRGSCHKASGERIIEINLF